MSRLAPWKLAAGQAWSAWRRYPEIRRSLASTSPGPPILVTGMYRSGTTRGGAMLAAAGLWPLHEPFNPNQGLWEEELAYAPADRARPDVDRLVGRRLRGRHRRILRLPGAGRWFAPVRWAPFAPRRILLKDPSAALLSEYLARRHGMRAVVVFRHPGAVVSSFLRLGWPTDALVRRLLESPALMRDWLGGFAATMEAATATPGARAGTVLYACVARVLLGFADRNAERMLELRFEELCADPRERFRALHRALELPYADRVRAAHARLTGGGSRAEESRPYGVVRSSRGIPDRWRAERTAAETAAIQDAWESFELPLYAEPSDWHDRGAGG